MIKGDHMDSAAMPTAPPHRNKFQPN